MIGNLIRKFVVVLIIILPAVSYSGCKKQAKCGCEGDILFSLTLEESNVYWNESGTSISFTRASDPYSTYKFCNPGEMFPKLSEYKTGDVLLVSGHIFWECNYLYQSSNYSYGSMYKVYEVVVTEVYANLYGKK